MSTGLTKDAGWQIGVTHPAANVWDFHQQP